MRLTAIELATIAAREVANLARLTRLRSSWNKPPSPTSRREPRLVVNIPFGNMGNLRASGRCAMLSWGPLRIGLKLLDEAAISYAILRLQSSARVWPDGTLRGIKKLCKVNGVWVSPSQGTKWEDGQTSAVEFKEDGSLRGSAGIHAVWPDQLDELTTYEGRLVELAGWGPCVVGDVGWRAFHAKVIRELL